MSEAMGFVVDLTMLSFQAAQLSLAAARKERDGARDELRRQRRPYHS